MTAAGLPPAMPAQRKPKLPFWRRAVIWLATPERLRPRRRKPKRDPIDIRALGIIYGTCLLIWYLGKAVWTVIWFLVWYQPKPAARAKPASGDDLRDREDWQAEFAKVRKHFIRLAERVLGAANLYCALCDDHFPTQGYRGITVDHRTAVSVAPELSFDFDNFQIACRSCNASKGARLARIEDRRPDKLRAAAAQARRAYLRRHAGVDPIHAIIAKHRAEHRRSWRPASWLRGPSHA